MLLKMTLLKKTDYNALKSKVDGIDVSKYVGRTKYETDGKAIYDKIDAIEEKIPVLNDFVTTARFNREKNLLSTKTALTTVENKVLDVSSLATKPALTAVENKIPNVTSFVKKTDFDSKITEYWSSY